MTSRSSVRWLSRTKSCGSPDRWSDIEQAAGTVIGHPGRGEFSLRPARAGDQATIRRLVRQGRINPSGLDWRRFVLAVDGEQRVIGCGQIKPHRGHASELASIVVDPHWRGGGVASAIIHGLMQAGPPLWLVCRAQLAPFYNRFGFRPVAAREPAPAHFRRLLRIGRWLNRLAPAGSQLVVMVWEGSGGWRGTASP